MKHEYIKTHLEKHEYIEGPEATANFNRVATAVFQSKKRTSARASAAPKKKAAKRKFGKVGS